MSWWLRSANYNRNDSYATKYNAFCRGHQDVYPAVEAATDGYGNPLNLGDEYVVV